MTAADIAALEQLLAPEFTLTHIGGYVQPKQEWLSQLRAGQFVYHEIKDLTVRVDVEGHRALLIGQTETDATVYGSRGRWRLQLSMNFEYQHGNWTPVRSVATTW